MYKNKKILAIIPARAGSKGIPKKNIIKVKGKPLISYTLEEALKSKYIDRLIVSTDSLEIMEVANKHGINTPYLRPKHLADDTSKTIDSIIYTLKKESELGNHYDYVVLLQPTQPLRKVFHIDDSIMKIIEKNSFSLVSVTLSKETPILLREITADEVLTPLLNESSTVRRQEFKKYYKVNGIIYINSVDKINLSTSLNDNITPFIIDEEFDLDIDDIEDLNKFKKLMED